MQPDLRVLAHHTPWARSENVAAKSKYLLIENTSTFNVYLLQALLGHAKVRPGVAHDVLHQDHELVGGKNRSHELRLQ